MKIAKDKALDFIHTNFLPDTISLAYGKYTKLLSKIDNIERLFSLFMMFCQNKQLLADFFAFVKDKGYYIDTLSPFTVYETSDKQEISYEKDAKSGKYLEFDGDSYVEDCIFVHRPEHSNDHPLIGTVDGKTVIRLRNFVIAHKSIFSDETLDKLISSKSPTDVI